MANYVSEVVLDNLASYTYVAFHTKMYTNSVRLFPIFPTAWNKNFQQPSSSYRQGRKTQLFFQHFCESFQQVVNG